MKERIQYKPAVDRTLQSNRNKAKKNTSLENFSHSTSPKTRTLQCAQAPNGISELHTQTESLISTIKLIGGNETTPLNDYIENSNEWAEETKLAAIRKLSEGHLALNEYNKNASVSGYKIKFADTARAKPDVQVNSGGRFANYEVKHISGNTDRLLANINEAMTQLYKTDPKGENYAVINVSFDHLAYWHIKIKSDSPSVENIGLEEVKRVITNHMINMFSNYHIILYYGSQELARFDGTAVHSGMATRT